MRQSCPSLAALAADIERPAQVRLVRLLDLQRALLGIELGVGAAPDPLAHRVERLQRIGADLRVGRLSRSRRSRRRARSSPRKGLYAAGRPGARRWRSRSAPGGRRCCAGSFPRASNDSARSLGLEARAGRLALRGLAAGGQRSQSQARARASIQDRRSGMGPLDNATERAGQPGQGQHQAVLDSTHADFASRPAGDDARSRRAGSRHAALRRRASRSLAQVRLADLGRCEQLLAGARHRPPRRSPARSRSARATSARCAFCSTSRMRHAAAAFTSRRIRKMVSTTCGASPSEGSSSSSSRGRLISARAMASICCSPPESVPASCLRALLEHGERA